MNRTCLYFETFSKSSFLWKNVEMNQFQMRKQQISLVKSSLITTLLHSDIGCIKTSPDDQDNINPPRSTSRKIDNDFPDSLAYIYGDTLFEKKQSPKSHSAHYNCIRIVRLQKFKIFRNNHKRYNKKFVQECLMSFAQEDRG